MSKRPFPIRPSFLQIVLAGYLLTVSNSVVSAQTQVERLRRSADSGDPNAQYELGNAHKWGFIRMSDGSGVEKSRKLALLYLRKAAEQNVPAAQFTLAQMLIEKIDDNTEDRDEVQALRLFRSFVKHNDIENKMIGWAYYEIGELFYKECDKYVISFFCGEMPGKANIQKNYRDAFDNFRKSGEFGFGDGQYQLATMYHFGRGVPQNYSEAARWYGMAHKNGNKYAAAVAAIVSEAVGDYVEAYVWANIASITGDKGAIENRDRLEKRLAPDQIRGAQQRALEIAKLREDSR